MNDRDRYDHERREPRTRRQDQDEGFFRRIRGWFSSDEEPRASHQDPPAGEWDNREDEEWDRTRQWRRPSGWNESRYTQRSSERYPGGEGRNRQEYRRGDASGASSYPNRDTSWRDRPHPGYREPGRNAQERSDQYSGQNARAGQTGYDWTFDRDYNYENDYHRDRGGDVYGLGQYGDWEEDYPTRYGLGRVGGRQNRPEDRDRYSRPPRRSGLSTPTAGMRSDFEASYRENEGTQSLNYRGGDVGYESEGAFYQDLDEPVNYEGWELWQVQGEYTGYGPRNYRRPDERINEDACERLTRHGRIDARDLEVDVKDGIVTLRGSVPYREMKRMAEDSLESISGVKDIHNEIRVQPRHGQRSDRWARGNEDRPAGRETSSRTGEGQQNQVTAREDHAPVSQGMNKTLATETGGAAAQRELREGMEVIASDGRLVGKVKEIRESDFLVDREMARDMYIPYAYVQSVGAQAMLTINHDELTDQGWEASSLA